MWVGVYVRVCVRTHTYTHALHIGYSMWAQGSRRGIWRAWRIQIHRPSIKGYWTTSFKVILVTSNHQMSQNPHVKSHVYRGQFRRDFVQVWGSCRRVERAANMCFLKICISWRGGGSGERKIRSAWDDLFRVLPAGGMESGEVWWCGGYVNKWTNDRRCQFLMQFPTSIAAVPSCQSARLFKWCYYRPLFVFPESLDFLGQGQVWGG